MKDYRYYLRDLNVNDDEYKNLIQDICDEIFSKTNILKKNFLFDVTNKTNIYNVNAMLLAYEKDVYANINEDCPNDSCDTGSYSKNANSIIDIVLVKHITKDNEYEIKQLRSSIGSDFYEDIDNILIYKGKKLEDGEIKRYKITVSTIPKIDSINLKIENEIRECLINGLRYKVNVMYNNTQYENIEYALKKDYYYSLNKLIDKYNVNAMYQKKDVYL